VAVVGEYTGALSNSGETLLFEDLVHSIVLFAMDFKDDWYQGTDGQGRSLVLSETGPWRRDWSNPDLWMPSQSIGGTPGYGE
jgi:hypothetical protein